MLSDAIPKEKLLPWEQNNSSIQGHDPHIWGDASLWIFVVEYATKKLISQVEAHADKFTPEEIVNLIALFEKNSKRYIKDLQQTHDQIALLMKAIPQEKRLLVSAHDAFNYYSKAYDIPTKALLGISTEAEASGKEIVAFVNWIITHNIQTIFLETSVPNKFLQSVVAGAKSRKHSVHFADAELFSDAMGKEGTFEGTYIGMLLHNANAINRALTKP